MATYQKIFELNPELKNPEYTASQKVQMLLHHFGIAPDLLGYQYVVDAEEAIARDPSLLHKNIVKQLYPLVARLNGTTPSRVERAIRHTIEVASSDAFSSFFAPHGGKPTNAQFLGELYALTHFFGEK